MKIARIVLPLGAGVKNFLCLARQRDGRAPRAHLEVVAGAVGQSTRNQLGLEIDAQ